MVLASKVISFAIRSSRIFQTSRHEEVGHMLFVTFLPQRANRAGKARSKCLL